MADAVPGNEATEALDQARLVHAVLTQPPAKSRGLLVLVVSLALFAASMQNGGSWRELVVLVAVVVVHELGHLVAMRAFGFSDLRMFFVPFFGAAASGRKPGAGATEHALVALAGPLPGLLVALAIVLVEAPRWVGFGLNPLLVDVTWMLVILNGFNLLPILPFDGGRVFQELLFARAPWLDVLFRIVAIGGVGWFAWRGMTVFGVVAAFMVIALPQRARVAFAVARLRRERSLPPEPEQLTVEELQAVFATAESTVPERLTPENRARVLVGAVRDVFDGAARAQASVLATLSLVLLWGAAVALAFVEVVWLLRG
ncbi:MAG: site-2 protease family protein [Planctomycetes bacterium]|nr:site-2 protease family protein [Planctomycetota bacterium]